jgi:2'-5' RNA ligase
MRSAVVVPTHEADVAGGSWGGDLTGVPMHVTLVVPFVPAERLDDSVIEALRAVLEPVEPFDYVLGGVCAFPGGTTYLAPRPPEPFVELVRAIERRWPEHPPYEGVHDTVVPHVTIPPEAVDLERLAALEPIPGRAEEAWLLVEEPGRWTTRARFRFSG